MMELETQTPRERVLAAFAERDRLVSAPRVIVFEGGKRIEQEPAGQYEAEEALKAAPSGWPTSLPPWQPRPRPPRI